MLAREAMIDLVLASYHDKRGRATSYLQRLPTGQHKYLFAVNRKNEGFFLIWERTDQPSVLNRNVFKQIVAESHAAHFTARYHVYASLASYTGAGIEFHTIPDEMVNKVSQ